MSEYISTGKIINFHGIKGEAKVGFTKNRGDFFSSLNFVFIEEKGQYKRLDIENIRITNKFAIVKFKDIDDINDIIPLKGKLLFVENQVIRENLDEDEYLIDELVGLIAYDLDGNKLGFVTGVSNNGANDLLSIKTNSNHICLVPFVDELVPEIDMENKRIVINNIEGLLE